MWSYRHNRRNKCSSNPPFPARNFPPSYLTYLWFYSPFEKYKQNICTEATEPYLFNTLNQIHVILNNR